MANFDPDLYLATRFYDVNVKERVLFPLQRFHEEFSALPGSLKILDYGTGPVMMTVISAARCASEIILSDYNQQNRESLKAWLNKDPDAFNWSPFFEHVVMKLEGKSKDEAREREFTLRKIVKDVVHCDIYASSILTEGYEGPYDVVSSSGCLDSISASRKANVKKLAAYLKPGGRMMLYLSERKMDRESGVYLIGSTEHMLVNVSGDYVAGVLKDIGFVDVKMSTFRGDEALAQKYQDEDYLGFLFVSGKKN